ncbi:sirohydrochlorin chelatase [Mycolicibacter icosiumassiliensis]|uniref:sirohydrochlorin chelatase n=1 Tax=Mycolicibacter icosiumassiliensis TaxID=1792835 RepID=UPI00082C41E1|nr:sirohydrochlorin chelatase [Mycolicibacter icosiumassiliensis]
MTPLILAAHGSRDPRSAANLRSVADRLAESRPRLDVQVAFLEHNAPSLRDVLAALPIGRRAVLTPFLLSSAYHARIDIPEQVRNCRTALRNADPLGEDDRLITVMHDRLAELGVSKFDTELGVVVTAVGSSVAEANARTLQVASKLAADTCWAAATTAFVTGSGRTPGQAVEQLRRRGIRRVVIAPWFLAPGLLLDRVVKFAAESRIPLAAPLGAHPLVAETVANRYDRALAQPAAA